MGHVWPLWRQNPVDLAPRHSFQPRNRIAALPGSEGEIGENTDRRMKIQEEPRHPHHAGVGDAPGCPWVLHL